MANIIIPPQYREMHEKAKRRHNMIMEAKLTGNWNVNTDNGTIVKQEMAMSWDEYLSNIYGKTIRRVSLDTALKYTIILPMLTGYQINSPSKTLEEGWNGNIVHHYEQQDTIRIGAHHLHGETWISSPHRAVLETACQIKSYTLLLHVLRAVTMSAFTAEEIVELANKLNMWEGAQRIASIAMTMHSFFKDESPKWAEEISFKIPVNASNILLSGDNIEHEERIYYEDKRNKVMWNITPSSVYEMTRN